ncbi:Ies4p [Saccharomyces eubayanus]|uniref:Ies4p n=1 Tax=Saccharomyces eubayanus TaxID=1080349 RepID=UPI0006C57377|nr:IES4-like protein [Saccharomyces eubayanus]KOG96682.1 IES4-like protein [Saccharomyces eubayanus]
MSQESSALSESQEQLDNNSKIENGEAASNSPRDNSKPVLPWDHESKAVEIKSFSGYKVELTGWIRRDIRQERQKQPVSESESNASDIKEPEDKSMEHKEPEKDEREKKEVKEGRIDGSES